MKICSHCQVSKSLSDFSVRTDTGGHRGQCKPCRATASRQKYDTSKAHQRYLRRKDYCVKKATQNKNRYIQQWKDWFSTQYPNPTCQVCSMRLDFSGSSSAVRFDHRNSKSKCVTKSPSDWFRERPCNEQNQQVFLDADFGILCIKCNSALPTAEREEWVRNVSVYVFGDQKVIMHAKRMNLQDLDWEY